MILLTKFLKDLRVKPLTLAVPIRYKPYNSAIWIIHTECLSRMMMMRVQRWKTSCLIASRGPLTWCVSGTVAGSGSGQQRWHFICISPILPSNNFSSRCCPSSCLTPSLNCSSPSVSWSTSCSWAPITTTWNTMECEYDTESKYEWKSEADKMYIHKLWS